MPVQTTQTPPKKRNISHYIKPEKRTLCIITVSGIFYNIGMTAGPWFEGRLAQYLCDIIGGNREFRDMVCLSVFYVVTILAVQSMRYIKRLYVRKFANQINRSMKKDIYHSLIFKTQAQLQEEGVGSLMTKAATDADACVEGIRKFTTEIFDTGVVMASYLVMLFHYDWQLTLLAMLFPPIAYAIAGKLKKVVTRSARAYKESEGQLNAATYDRISNAMTYRIYGQESARNGLYEDHLTDYEKKAVRANLWENTMQPLYLVISMAGAICILWFGGKNVLGEGWTAWNIAIFVTYLSCFTKLAAKSSKTAKLFNAVQKASVSWKRIRPFLEDDAGSEKKSEVSTEEKIKRDESNPQNSPDYKTFTASHVSFRYPGGPELISDFSCSAKPGEIIGITGPVACGKSTLGKLFLGNLPYCGTITIHGSTAYMGHEPELICGTIEENILLGACGNASEALKWVQMEQEVEQMPEGIRTRIGNDGITLSGGQQARIALARTLFHRKELIILDDPFSAVDRTTERAIFSRIRQLAVNSTVIIISHRLSLFPEMDQVIWLNNGKAETSDHRRLITSNREYADLYETQVRSSNTAKGAIHHEA